MAPDEHLTALAGFSRYVNSEGVFSNAELMQLTEDGHKCRIPTYQFWDLEGETAH